MPDTPGRRPYLLKSLHADHVRSRVVMDFTAAPPPSPEPCTGPQPPSFEPHVSSPPVAHKPDPQATATESGSTPASAPAGAQPEVQPLVNAPPPNQTGPMPHPAAVLLGQLEDADPALAGVRLPAPLVPFRIWPEPRSPPHPHTSVLAPDPEGGTSTAPTSPVSRGRGTRRSRGPSDDARPPGPQGQCPVRSAPRATRSGRIVRSPQRPRGSTPDSTPSLFSR